MGPYVHSERLRCECIAHAAADVVADHDQIAVTDLALHAYERALEPKRLVMIKGGRFDPYLGEFETASGAAIEWFKANL